MSLRRLAPLLLLGLGLAIFIALDLGRYFDFASLRRHHGDILAWVTAHPVAAPLAYATLYILVVTFSLPVASFLTVAGGILFGAVWGTLWTLAGATLGSGLVFLAARSAFGGILRARAGPRLQRLQHMLEQHGFHYLLFLRLVPLFPFWLVNIAPAVFGMPLGTYLAATVIGILPGTFIVTYFGHGLAAVIEQSDTISLQAVFTPEILLALCLLALLSLLPVWLKRRGFGAGETPDDH